LTFPCNPALRIALSCVLKISGCVRQKRIARQPRKGFSSWPRSRHSAGCHPDVERPDDDGMRGDTLGHLPVDRILFLLVGWREAVEVEELRAVETDSLRSARRDLVDFLRDLDVGREGDASAIPRHRIGSAQALEALLDVLLFLGEGLVGGPGGGGGIEEDLPAVAVHQDRAAVLEARGDPLQPHDGGDAERPRHDGGVGGLAPLLGDKPGDVFPVEGRRVRGGQLVGHDDVAAVVPPETLARLAEKLAEHAAGHVLKVNRPLAQVGVVDRGEGPDEFLGDRIEDEFGVVPIAADPLEHLIDQAGILKHQQVGVEDARIPRGGGLGEAFLKRLQLPPCCKQSCLKTNDFRI